MRRAQPVIRWIGGKRNFVPKLAPQITYYLNESGGRYIEPFVGGGAMALALGRPRMLVGDTIEDLVNLYVAIRDEPDRLCSQLIDMREWGTEEENYYIARDTDPGTNPVDVATRMVYLSSHSFNGLWRTNQEGKMNAAYGKRSGRITEELLDKIWLAHRALGDTNIFHRDFEHLLRMADKDDLVYLDPPYWDTYTGYSGGGFSEADHERLALLMYEAVDRGAAVLIHNSDTPLTRFWYEGLYAVVTKEPRNVNRDGKGRGKTGCLLASNVPALLSAYA